MKQKKKIVQVVKKTQSKKIPKRTVRSSGKNKISKKLLFGIGALFVALFITVIFSSQQQNLQGNAAGGITPSYVNLAPCSSNGNCPSSSPATSGGQKISLAPGTTGNPSTAPSGSTTQPCTSSKSVGQTSAKSHSGFSGNILQLIMQFFQLILQWLSQLLGRETGTTPGTGSISPSTAPSGTATSPSGSATAPSGTASSPSSAPAASAAPCPPSSAPSPSGSQSSPSGSAANPSTSPGSSSGTGTGTSPSPTGGSTTKAGAITNLQITGYNQTGVSFSWTAAPNATKGYSWKLTSVSGQGITMSGTTTATHVSVTGLTKPGVYNFGIQGLPGGPGDNIHTPSMKGATTAAAGAISGLQITGYNQTGVSFAWNAATGATQGYSWKLTSVSGQGITMSGTTTATQHSVTGLTKPGVYNFGIQALPGGPGNNIHTPSLKG